MITQSPTPTGLSVADLLDRYYREYVDAEGLRSAKTTKGHLNALKEGLGSLGPTPRIERIVVCPSTHTVDD